MPSLKRIYRTKNEIVWLFLCIGLTCFYMVLATLANTDLTVGRFALFMDERITFDGVRNILHPHGMKDFILSVIHGGDHRYGRSLWNSIAIFTFLPEHFLGESGQIFAGRMTQVTILLTAFILLTMTFVKHWALRFLLLASLLAMPYTDYYMSMPKPEPLQMLFMAIFLFFFKKNEMGLTGWYWIFIGLAFGTKISTLPAVAVYLLASFLKYLSEADIKKFAAELIGAFGYFLTGLAIAVPILAPHVAISIAAFKIVEKLLADRHVNQQWLFEIFAVVGLVIFNFVVAGLLYFKFGIGIKTPLVVWVQSTFLNTSHGADSDSVGFGSWVDFFFDNWMIAPVAVTGLVIAISVVLVIRLFLRKSEDKKFTYSKHATPLVIMLSGIALNASIFVAAHRLWGFYLFPGTILILVGLFAIFENYLFVDNIWLRNHGNQGKKLEHCFSLSGLLLVTAITFYWWLPNSIVKYNELTSRTSNLEYKKQYQLYIEVTEFLSQYANQKDKRLMVSFDPMLFSPQSNDKYQIIEFWGPYTNWEANHDVIILGESHNTLEHQQGPDSPLYVRDSLVKEREGYNKYVIDKGGVCLREKCYQRYLRLANGGEILVLMLPERDG